MQTNPRLLIAALTVAGALPAQYFEARNAAMGGAGVASSRYVAAGWANPALLASAEPTDRFAMIIPTVGLRAYDETDLASDVDAFVDSFEALDNNPLVTGPQLQELGDQLTALGGRRVNTELGGGLAFAMPSDTLAWSVHAQNYTDLQLFAKIDPLDDDLIANTVAGAPFPTLDSNARALGVSVTEIGVSLASRFVLAGVDVGVGLTPKFQRVDTFNYGAAIDDFDASDFNEGQYQSSDNAFNCDAGLTLDWNAPGLRFGLMARNLSAATYTTVDSLGSSFDYELGPQATAGLSWRRDDVTLAVDADLNALERFDDDDIAAALSPGASFSDDVQMARFGAEFTVCDWLQLRGGYAHDLEGSLADAISAGVGLNGSGNILKIDLSGVYVDGQSYGAVAQVTLTF